MDNNILIKINSRYGIVYWPRDFINYDELKKIEITEKDISSSEDINNFKDLSPEKKFFYKYLRNGYINLSVLNNTYNNVKFEIKDGFLFDMDEDGISTDLSLYSDFDITKKNKKSGATTTLTVSDICS